VAAGVLGLALAFLLELVPALLLGMLLARRWPDLAGVLAPPLVRWGVPFSLMGLLLRSGLHWDVLEMGVLAMVAVGSGLLVVQRWCSSPAERLGAVVGNTAYFGIPAALALLPPQALSYAISYDLAGTLFTWTIGPSLMAQRRLALQPLLTALVRSPASQGLLGAALLQLSPWDGVLAAWLWWPARAVVWLSLVVLGLRIAPVLGRALPFGVLVSMAIKLVLFPLAVLVMAVLLRLPPLLLAPLVLQAAAPTAVAVLLLAESVGTDAGADRGADTRRPAALVLWSTLAALLTVPLWAWLLQLLGLSGGLSTGTGA
jgi:predicted permease